MFEKFRVITNSSGRYLRIEGDVPAGFEGTPEGEGCRCPLTNENANALRKLLPMTAPQLVGLRKSVGLGDRLGIATAGHLRAVCEGDMFPVLAQQSIREMQRVRRSAADVLDDATWGVLEARYTQGFGCDGDHLKTTDDLDVCIDAGFIGFTLDPGQYVDDSAAEADDETLKRKAAALDWDRLATTPEVNRAFYLKEGVAESEYLRAVVKYGQVLMHIAALTEHIKRRMGNQPFDLEISVDETDTVTTLAEHRYIALELRRLNIPFTGLAPHFVGSFEKGVDYIGDLTHFEESYRQHAQLAHELGGYKLSIHSGSDKFSLYPIIAKHSNPNVHLKTSGTSWLEALRVIAAKNPPLFREILKLAIDGFTENAASYHISANPQNIRVDLPDAKLQTVLESFDGREVLHVAFGAVLSTFRSELYETLYASLNTYHDYLHTHFNRHIQPFRE